MGGVLLLLFVLQTIIGASLSVTLPFPNAIGTVTPIKPRPLPSSVPEVLPSIKSLECDGEDILSPLFSSLGISREFSSPVALQSSSRALPVPKIDNIPLSKVKIPEGLEDSLPESIKTLLKGGSVKDRNSDVCSTEIFFPFKRLHKDAIKIPKLYENKIDVKPRCEDMCSSPSVSEVSIKANPFAPQVNKFTSVTQNPFVPTNNLLPNIKSPAIGPVDPLKKSAIESTLPKFANTALSTVGSQLLNTPNPIVCSSNIVSDTPTFKSTATPFSELPKPCFTPTYTGPSAYPLFYRSRFLPRVRTPEFSFGNCRPPFIPTGCSNVPNPPDFPNLVNPIPPLPCHLNTFNERKPCPELTCLPQPPIKPTCEPIPPCVNPIPMTERPNFCKPVQIPKIPPPLCTEPGFCPTRVQCPCQYNNPFTPAVGSENICLSYPCTTLDTSCTDNILPILDPIPFVTVNDISYSYPNGLPKVTPTRPCESRLVFPPDVCCSNTPIQCTPTCHCKDNHSKTKPTPISSKDESNCKNNFDSNTRSSDFSIPNMFPIVDAFVDSLNNHKCVNIPDVCTTPRCPETCSCTTCVPPVIPTNNCCSKIYTSSESPTSSYINISPTCPLSKSSAKIVSSINDMVANITQNLLSSYISCLKSEPKPVCKKPQCSPKYTSNIPEFNPKAVPARSFLPPVNLSYEKSPAPINYSPTKTNYYHTSTNYSPTNSNYSPLHINCCPQTECPIIIQLDSLFPSNTPTYISPSSDTSPLLSLINYSSPLTPSYLPSPTLPYSSPFYPEPPVIKLSSCKSKKDKDRALELMILSELLDGDDNYEWDELDTLLALLAIS